MGETLPFSTVTIRRDRKREVTDTCGNRVEVTAETLEFRDVIIIVKEKFVEYMQLVNSEIHEAHIRSS